MMAGTVLMAGFAAFLAVLYPSFACADDGFGAGSFTVQFENDRIANTDRHYTHGSRLSWTSEEFDKPPEQASWLPGAINPFGENGTWRTAVAVGQNIYTPENIADPALIVDDRPYAGWLYAGFSLFNEQRPHPNTRGWDSLNTLEMDIGIVGPQAYAEDVQTMVHQHINVTRPNGWDHQLKTEPGVALLYEWKLRKRITDNINPEGFSLDLLPHSGLSVGNVDTHAKLGAMVRAGYNVPDDFGPPHIRPNVSGPGYVDSIDDLGFYVFVGGEQRIIGRNIFLDGNTFADSHSVDKRLLVGDFQFGAAIILGRMTLAYSHVFRTREFNGQTQPDRFGAFSLSFNL
jgi:lipid A 3-O-deacylase